MDPVVKAFDALFGMPCWQVVNFHGSMLMVEFGSPSVEVAEPIERPTRVPVGPVAALQRRVTVAGEWTLTINQCAWDLQIGSQILADSESPEPTMSRALRVLNGQALSSVRVDWNNAVTAFDFDLGATLLSRPYESGIDVDEPDELWTLRSPDGQYLGVRGDGRYGHHDGDASPDDYVWLTYST